MSIFRETSKIFTSKAQMQGNLFQPRLQCHTLFAGYNWLLYLDILWTRQQPSSSMARTYHTRRSSTWTTCYGTLWRSYQSSIVSAKRTSCNSRNSIRSDQSSHGSGACCSLAITTASVAYIVRTSYAEPRTQSIHARTFHVSARLARSSRSRE